MTSRSASLSKLKFCSKMKPEDMKFHLVKLFNIPFRWKGLKIMSEGISDKEIKKLGKYVVGREEPFLGQYEHFNERPPNDNELSEYWDKKEGNEHNGDEANNVISSEDIRQEVKQLLKENFAYVCLDIVDGARAFDGLKRDDVTDDLARKVINTKGVDAIITKKYVVPARWVSFCGRYVIYLRYCTIRQDEKAYWSYRNAPKEDFLEYSIKHIYCYGRSSFGVNHLNSMVSDYLHLARTNPNALQPGDSTSGDEGALGDGTRKTRGKLKEKTEAKMKEKAAMRRRRSGSDSEPDNEVEESSDPEDNQDKSRKRGPLLHGKKSKANPVESLEDIIGEDIDFDYRRLLAESETADPPPQTPAPSSSQQPLVTGNLHINHQPDGTSPGDENGWPASHHVQYGVTNDQVNHQTGSSAGNAGTEQHLPQPDATGGTTTNNWNAWPTSMHQQAPRPPYPPAPRPPYPPAPRPTQTNAGAPNSMTGSPRPEMPALHALPGPHLPPTPPHTQGTYRHPPPSPAVASPYGQMPPPSTCSPGVFRTPPNLQQHQPPGPPPRAAVSPHLQIQRPHPPTPAPGTTPQPSRLIGSGAVSAPRRTLLQPQASPAHNHTQQQVQYDDFGGSWADFNTSNTGDHRTAGHFPPDPSTTHDADQNGYTLTDMDNQGQQDTFNRSSSVDRSSTSHIDPPPSSVVTQPTSNNDGGLQGLWDRCREPAPSPQSSSDTGGSRLSSLSSLSSPSTPASSSDEQQKAIQDLRLTVEKLTSQVTTMSSKIETLEQKLENFKAPSDNAAVDKDNPASIVPEITNAGITFPLKRRAQIFDLALVLIDNEEDLQGRLRQFLIADCPMPTYMKAKEAKGIIKHMLYSLFALPMAIQIKHGEVTHAVMRGMTGIRSANVDLNSASFLAKYREEILQDESIRVDLAKISVISKIFHTQFEILKNTAAAHATANKKTSDIPRNNYGSVLSRAIRDTRSAERKFRDGIKRTQKKDAWPAPPLKDENGKPIDYYGNFNKGPILEEERETKMVEWYTVVERDMVKAENESKKERACWL